MSADKTPLPPYARRGVLLVDRRLEPRHPLSSRTVSRFLWEEYLRPLLRRMNPRKRS